MAKFFSFYFYFVFSIHTAFNMPAVFSSLARSLIEEQVRDLLLGLPGALTHPGVLTLSDTTSKLVEDCIAVALNHQDSTVITIMCGLDETTKNFSDGPMPSIGDLNTDQIGEMACAIANKTGTVPPLRFLLTVAKACALVPASEASASAGGHSALTDFEDALIKHLKGDNDGAQFLRGNEYGHMWELFFGPIMRMAGQVLAGESGDAIINAYFAIVAGIYFVNSTPAAGWHSCRNRLHLVRIDSLAATLAIEIGYMLGLLSKRDSPRTPHKVGNDRKLRQPPQRTLGDAAGLVPPASAGGAQRGNHARKPASAPRDTSQIPCNKFNALTGCPWGERCKFLHFTPEEQAKKAKERSWAETRRTDAAIVADLGATPRSSGKKPATAPAAAAAAAGGSA